MRNTITTTSRCQAALYRASSHWDRQAGIDGGYAYPIIVVQSLKRPQVASASLGKNCSSSCPLGFRHQICYAIRTLPIIPQEGSLFELSCAASPLSQSHGILSSCHRRAKGGTRSQLCPSLRMNSTLLPTASPRTQPQCGAELVMDLGSML